MRAIAITVNDTRHELEVEPRELLVYVLRERLGLTGTNVGCDTTSCGACTVLFDGESVKSCTVLAVQADARSVTTIEGLAENGTLHPVQESFWAKHGLQCGFCTPGMILASVALLKKNPAPTPEQVRHGLEGNLCEHPDPSEEEIRKGLEGNLCRCTGYVNIVKAVRQAAAV